MLPENIQSPWALIAHGGAKEIAPEDEIENRKGMYEAIKVGSTILSDGGTALETVEAVVRVLENNPAYNAGLFGSAKNEEGKVELTASIMDGKTLDIGAVANLRDIEHPVSVARAILRDKAIFLAGEGAMRFAEQQGFRKFVITSADPKRGTDCDTVGCVARDQWGNLAAATSTAGLEGSRVGRVGDVPLPGCGFYADDMRGAVSASGEGEAIARIMLAAEFLYFLKDHHPDEAVERALVLLERVKGEAGLITITTKGEIGWGHNSQNFVIGFLTEGGEPSVYLKKSEEKQDIKNAK